MPNNTRRYPFANLLANSHSCEHLLITHDVLLVGRFNFSINLTLRLHIRYAVLNQEQQAFRRAHRSDDTVSRSIYIKIGLILRCCMNNLAVEIGKNFLFNSRVNFFIGIFLDKRGYFCTRCIFLSKAVKRSLITRSSTIERTLNWHDAAHRVVLHVVGENHKLRNIDKSAELLVRKTLFIHACTFRNHTAVIVRFLNLNKDEGQTVYKQRDVRSKLVLVSLAGELCSTMIYVVFWIIEIHKSDGGHSS